MRNQIQKKVLLGSHLENEVLVNVFDLAEKGKIVFTGNLSAVAKFVGVHVWNLPYYLKTKGAKCKKKYALRYAKTLS